MKARNAADEVLHKALEKLEEATGFMVEAHPEASPEGPDAVVRITWKDLEWNFAAEVKRNLTRPMIGAVVKQLRRHLGKGILVTKT